MNKYIKNIVFLLILVFGLFLSLNVLAVGRNPVNLYFFRGDGCPHCADEEIFLKKLAKDYSNLKINDYEIWYNSENRDILKKSAEALGVEVSGVPFMVVGDKYIIGYLNDESTGKEIENLVKNCSENVCVDPLAKIVLGDEVKNGETEKKSVFPEKMTLPFIGEISTKNFSLPLFTIVIGAIDGFNPCAMWTLIFLISLLLEIESKFRRWTLGLAFIITSGAVYFMFLSAWLNLLLFIGFIAIIRIIIGFVALGGGAYNIREYFKNKDNVCKVTTTPERKSVFENLKKITQKKHFWLALGGIILLAAAVNLVELICSAGLPAVYTQVLSLSNLPSWQYYMYLVLYIIIFMLDDVIVFVIAMTTLELTGVTGKYSRLSHLLGGLVLLIIGILLLLKPEWLMWG